MTSYKLHERLKQWDDIKEIQKRETYIFLNIQWIRKAFQKNLIRFEDVNILYCANLIIEKVVGNSRYCNKKIMRGVAQEARTRKHKNVYV
jgi:hypothetical protein